MKSKHNYTLSYLFNPGSFYSCHLEHKKVLFMDFYFLNSHWVGGLSRKIDSDQIWLEETHFFCKVLLSPPSTPYIKFTPTTSPRCVKNDSEGGVGQHRDMSFLEFSELSHAE